MTNHLITFSDVERREVVWLEPGKPRGMVVILAGDPGLGKSLCTLKTAAQLSLRGEHSIICSAEDSIEYTIKPRLDALGADTSKIHSFTPLDKDGNMRGVSFPTDAALLRDEIRDVSAIYVALDPIGALLDAKVDSHKDASLRSALAPLARIAEETLATIEIVWHLNKSVGSDPMQRLGGSIGGPGAARSCLLLDRDPDDADQDRGTRRVLAHFKCNVGPLGPSRLLEVEAITLPASNLEPEVSTARIVDTGESPHAATALLASIDDGGVLTDAAEFLIAELADGAVDAAQMLRRAKNAGIAERTLNRAKKHVGVISERSGFGRDGIWTWRLKTATPEPRQSMAFNDDVLAINGAIDGHIAIDGHRQPTKTGDNL